jgi:hypothetical protein
MPVYNPDITMSKEDKLKTACWFRRICDAIEDTSYPPDWIEDVKTSVKKFKKTATNLEAECFITSIEGAPC